MIKKVLIFMATAFCLAISIFILTPVGVERSEYLAKTRFETYCIENQFDCSKFEGPKFMRTNEKEDRIYVFKRAMEGGQVLSFEVRVPADELGRVGLGIVDAPREIRKYLGKR